MIHRPRILFIMHMPPPIHGASMVGQYIHDSNYVNSLFECTYLNPTTAKNLEDVNKFRFAKLLDVFHLIRQIKTEVQDRHPNLIYFTANASGMAFLKDCLIMHVLKQRKCKIVVHYHNKGVANHQDQFIYNLLYKHFFNGIRVIQLSEYLYPDIKKYVEKKNVYFCPNGIPDSSITTNTKESLDNKTLNILYLSNMMVDKGVWTLVDACRIMHEKGVDFKCHFVGGWKDISEAEFHKRIVQYELSERVFAYGAKYGEDKDFFWKQADVFVFPTLYECFGLVLLEAMQHSVPCISTYEGAIPSIIDNGETGKLFPAGDSTALAEILTNFAKQDRNITNTMGETGRKKFERNYTLHAFEKKFAEGLNWAMQIKS